MAIGGCGAADAASGPSSVRTGCPRQPRGAGGYAPRSDRSHPGPSPIPEIPPQRPAALEPVWSNEKLILPPRPATTDGDKRANAAALKALRAELIELADDVEAEPSNFDKRAATYLRRIAERIPDRTPPKHEFFASPTRRKFSKAMDRPSTINGPTISLRASTR